MIDGDAAPLLAGMLHDNLLMFRHGVERGDPSVRGKCSSVVVFLGDLPARLTVRELKDLVRGEIRTIPSAGLQVGNSICECSILRITDLDTGIITHHGLVEIRPPLLALKIIDRLDGKALGNDRISARRYRQRSPMGSPRPKVAGEGIDSTPAILERRRSNIRIELAETERDIFGGFSSTFQLPRWIWPGKRNSTGHT